MPDHLKRNKPSEKPYKQKPGIWTTFKMRFNITLVLVAAATSTLASFKPLDQTPLIQIKANQDAAEIRKA